MIPDINEFVKELKIKLEDFDFKEVESRCDKLYKFLIQTDDPVPFEIAEEILRSLRNKRLFYLIQKIADALLQTGRGSFTIQRQYAQSLIELGNYTAALSILQNLISDTSNAQSGDSKAKSENAEAKGLLGRVYKQLYINTNILSNPQCKKYISSALDAYYDVYNADNTKTWHGINTVALLERAKKDRLELALQVNSMQLAGEILINIEKRNNEQIADTWDYATAGEACVALDRPEEALKWFSGYARMPECDAFELGSTLRQLEEIWQLDLESRMGQLLLPLLRSELMERKGAVINLRIDEIIHQQKLQTTVEAQYRSLIENITSAPNDSQTVVLERVFGEDSFKTYKWYMLGAARCLAVARIGRDTSRGMGTGFLLRGKDLKEELGDELILLTNAHVVSINPADKALKPEEAIIIFEALNAEEEFKDLEIIWSSPNWELDATVLRFSKADKERLETLTKELKLYPISKYLLPIETPSTQKVYVIGHPHGGTLQISFQDNLLIDHDNASKIHYRAPTEPGSSGSPVFNQQWELIGLHHAGSDTMPCLNGKPGAYKANEGIWILAIKEKMKS